MDVTSLRIWLVVNVICIQCDTMSPVLMPQIEGCDHIAIANGSKALKFNFVLR